MHRRRCLLFTSLFTIGLASKAQNDVPCGMIQFAEHHVDSLWRPEILGYLRNTEFFHRAEEGRTRFGALVGVRRGYVLKRGRSAEFGLILNQAFGAGPKAMPWAVLRAKGSGYSIQFGSIADRGHNLPRQLLNPDLRYAVPVVYGVSGTAAGRGLKAHYWAEWLSAIDYGSPFKEQIHGGATAGWVGEQGRFEGLFQYHHVGGQIDSSPESDGNRLNYGIIAGIHSKAFEVRAVHLRYVDPLKRFGPEKSGFGTSVEAQLQLGKKASIDASYWGAENFRAPLGQGIFQCRNPEDPMSWYRRDSQILGIGIRWEGASSFRIRAWYDLADQRMQPSVTWIRYVVLDPL